MRAASWDNAGMHARSISLSSNELPSQMIQIWVFLPASYTTNGVLGVDIEMQNTRIHNTVLAASEEHTNCEHFSSSVVKLIIKHLSIGSVSQWH